MRGRRAVSKRRQLELICGHHHRIENSRQCGGGEGRRSSAVSGGGGAMTERPYFACVAALPGEYGSRRHGGIMRGTSS